MIIVICCLSACAFRGGQHRIVFHNHTTTALDSTVFNINQYKFSFPRIAAGDSSIIVINSGDISAHHDVVYRFSIYVADTVIAQKTFFSNDMGRVAPVIAAEVTDSLKIQVHEYTH